MEDKLIMVATMLFILSMISERVVTFFKLWCVEGNSFLFFIVPKEVDTSKKQVNETLENKRQRAILSINLTISFFIALISNASLFKMFTYDNNANTDFKFLLGWDFETLDLHAFASMVIGCALTACFISLGSKFWHDLLDMLFYAKSLKEKLVDKTTYEAATLKELDTKINTPEAEIVEKLFDTYEKQIIAIKGVVTHGINTIYDGQTKLNRRKIEVEFTTPEAHQQLIALQNTGSVTINEVRFPMKDYLVLLPTEKIEALTLPIEITNPPVCYAYNDNSPDDIGSFGVIRKEDKFFAISNLHVLADSAEFANFNSNTNYLLKNLDVSFVIGDNPPFKASIDIESYQFGNINGYGVDFCMCEISQEVYEAYNRTIDAEKIKGIDENKMRMCGAWSKYTDFSSLRQPTLCEVSYNAFSTKLYLFKIKTTSISNISKGDSGSVIYYKINDNGTIYLNKGILVAKSTNYAYMFRYFG